MIPGVTLICLDSIELEQEEKIEYESLCVEYVSWKTDGLHGVFQVILDTENPYICFTETGKMSDCNKIQKMVEFLEEYKNTGCVLCQQEYILENGTHVSWMKQMYMRELDKNGKVLNGNGLLELSLNLEENLFGSLTCCMLRREYFINKDFLMNYLEYSKAEEQMLLMFECLYGMNVGRISENLVKVIERDLDIAGSLQEDRLFKSLKDRILNGVYKRKAGNSIALPGCYLHNRDDRHKFVGQVEKDITLFHMGKAEYYVLEPLAKEAEKRGYHVSFSEDIGKEAEIGIYCSHVGCLERGGYHAKLSLIMLHDMTQGELDWPNLWNEESWDGFDIGILPGKTWTERWKTCSGFAYAHPKLGVYEAGYPKEDYIYQEESRIRTENMKKSLGLLYDKTILYAPSWENDGKEDDFVQALCDLPVNLLIKQGTFDNMPSIRKNISKMREMHEGKYDNVYYMDARSNIMDAYPFCDVVVSDESGALTEALLFGIPSIAVVDWLIPDVSPSRFSFVPVDYVNKCKKEELRKTVEKVLGDGKCVRERQANQLYSNRGKASSNILDLVDYYTGQSDNKECLNMEVQPCHKLHGVWN